MQQSLQRVTVSKRNYRKHDTPHEKTETKTKERVKGAPL